MTDRHAGYIVTLEKEVREDDAEVIINALRMIKRVVDVHPINSTSELVIARDMVKNELREKFLDFYRENL